eukprot:Gb_33890 [translate_table: standard]
MDGVDRLFTTYQRWIFRLDGSVKTTSAMEQHHPLHFPSPVGDHLCPYTEKMADASEKPSAADTAISAVTEKLSELPASKPADVTISHAPSVPYRLFNRQKTIHEILGGGKFADVILWKRRNICIGILVAASAAWVLFEQSGYTLLSLVTNVLLLLVAILFIWANAATLLHRPPPPLPELELSEEMVNNAAASIRVRINYALAVAHDIALGKDLKLFFKVVFCLWLLSIFGGWFNFLTLAYISLLVSLTIPALYNKYEDHVDRNAEIAQKEIIKHYRKLDENFLSKLSKGFSKEKKMQ